MIREQKDRMIVVYDGVIGLVAISIKRNPLKK